MTKRESESLPILFTEALRTRPTVLRAIADFEHRAASVWTHQKLNRKVDILERAVSWRGIAVQPLMDDLLQPLI